jgi:hypothetical protein
MKQHKLSLLAVTLIGAFACEANDALVGIEDFRPDSGAGTGGESAIASGAAGAAGSGVVGGGEATAPQGIFVPTGSMTVARLYHTATLLPNGKVLIAGGDTFAGGGYQDLGSAELYDPSTGTFALTGSLITPRARHTATLLPNGKVLIAGGSASYAGGTSGYAALASAELYDPSTGTFAATASMSLARCAHRATLLGNGKVLVTAGWDGAQGDHANADLYDPDSGTFAPTGKMVQSRAWHTATLLGNGKVLIAGGEGEPSSTSAELYDPSAGTFAAAGTMTMPRSGHTATLLPNGKVLIEGYCQGDPSLRAELYDPTDGLFVAAGDETSAREWQKATLLPGGMVLIAGGESWLGGPDLFFASAELYDPGTGKFSPTVSMHAARGEGHTTTLLSNGQVLITGGISDTGTLGSLASLASAELYQ